MSSLGLPQIRLPSGSRLFWKKKRSAVISDVDPQYRVTYLGNVLTGWAKGESTTYMYLPLGVRSKGQKRAEGRVGDRGRRGAAGAIFTINYEARLFRVPARSCCRLGRPDQRGEPFISMPIFSPSPHFPPSLPRVHLKRREEGSIPFYPLPPLLPSFLL